MNLNFKFASAIFTLDGVSNHSLQVLSFCICAIFSLSLLLIGLHCLKLVMWPQLHLGYLNNIPDIHACFRFHRISLSTSSLLLENRLLVHRYAQSLYLKTNHGIFQKCPGQSFRSHSFLIKPIFSPFFYYLTRR